MTTGMNRDYVTEVKEQWTLCKVLVQANGL